jgi:predicted nucleotidyltransferase
MGGRTPCAVLDDLRDVIRATLCDFGVIEAGVFGSAARGDDHVGSDLDLIVEFEPGRRPGAARLSDALADLTGLCVDVVDLLVVRTRAAKTGIGTTILPVAVSP